MLYQVTGHEKLKTVFSFASSSSIYTAESVVQWVAEFQNSETYQLVDFANAQLLEMLT